MRRMVIVLVMVVLLVPMIVSAQRESLSETYEGDGIRFSYPEGWMIQTNEDGSISLQNMPFEALNYGTEIPPGGIALDVSRSVFVDGTAEVINSLANTPEYALGYIAGVLSRSDLFTLSFTGDEPPQIDIGVPTHTSIGSFDGFYSVATVTNDWFNLLLLQNGEFAVLVRARTPAGEMERWQKFIFALAETIELSDGAATQPAEPLLTGESLTRAFEDLIAGNPEPAKALSCEDDHQSIDEAAEALTELSETEGVETSISCVVDANEAKCEMTIVVEIEGQEPIEQSQTITSQIVDGKLCGEFE